MNKAWAQRWIKLFDGHTDELMELYAEDIRFEDVDLGVQINNDKARLRKFFTTFANRDPAIAIHHFDVFDYEGDEQMGCFQWTWETEHKKVLAVELRVDGITANYLIPGVILTAMTKPIMDFDPAMKAAFESFSVLGRVGLPIDVARAALFLASSEASFITGHGLAVDGGRLAKL